VQSNKRPSRAAAGSTPLLFDVSPVLHSFFGVTAAQRRALSGQQRLLVAQQHMVVTQQRALSGKQRTVTPQQHNVSEPTTNVGDTITYVVGQTTYGDGATTRVVAQTTYVVEASTNSSVSDTSVFYGGASSEIPRLGGAPLQPHLAFLCSDAPNFPLSIFNFQLFLSTPSTLTT